MFQIIHVRDTFTCRILGIGKTLSQRNEESFSVYRNCRLWSAPEFSLSPPLEHGVSGWLFSLVFQESCFLYRVPPAYVIRCANASLFSEFKMVTLFAADASMASYGRYAREGKASSCHWNVVMFHTRASSCIYWFHIFTQHNGQRHPRSLLYE